MLTYQTVIRTYSASMASGHADVDLTPRQRRLTHVLLNLASNAGWACVVYPPTDETRAGVRKALGAIVWDARPLVDAAIGRPSDRDFDIALGRALEVLTNC